MFKVYSCDWEITNSCNLHCKHCISDSGKKRPNELNTNNIIKGVHNLHELGCKEINFTGGEPLFRKDFFDILEFCKHMGIKTRFITNGSLITQHNVKKIKNHVSIIGISLDGANEKLNDVIRGKGSFKKTIKTLKLLKQHKIRAILHITLNKSNYRNIRELIELGRLFGISQFSISTVTLKGRAEKKPDLKLNIGDIKYIISLLREIGVKKLNSHDNCDITPSYIFINSEGNIYPCSGYFQKYPNNNFGSVLFPNKIRIQKF